MNNGSTNPGPFGRLFISALRTLDEAFDESVGERLNWKERVLYGTTAVLKALRRPYRTFRRLEERAYDRATIVWPRPAKPIDAATEQFLQRFWKRYRRAPRVLHVGNVANNAYLNAKLLNQSGYDCDVICYDYYHVMACPEWEDAGFSGEIADQLHPDWLSLRPHGFTRPTWFAQGPQKLCIEYLVAKRSSHTVLADALWQQLGAANKTMPVRSAAGAMMHRAAGVVHGTWQTMRVRDAARRLWGTLERWAQPRGRHAWLAAALAAPVLMCGLVAGQLIARRRRQILPVTLPTIRLDGVNHPGRRFALLFPNRPDQLAPGDWGQFATYIDRWAELFSHYDIVQAYATDVVYPMLSGKRPYLGFEHGTLRDFTFGDSPTCRLTAMGYRQADHVLITNGDCLEYAQKLGITSFTAMVHPIDDDRIRSAPDAYQETHRKYGVRYLFLCPLRHDWSVKGTDKYIRALPAIAERIGRDFRVIMTRWGAQLDDSQALARSLGVDDLIAWVEPLNRGQLIRLQKSVDVIFDQIALPHFGATAPQAIAAGVPVIMSYNPASTEWIIDEPAPILAAWTVDEIVTAVVQALDPEWRAAYAVAAKHWFDTHHSGDQAVRRLSVAYDSVCEATGIL